MGIDPYALQAERLADRLSALEVRGEVIDKKIGESEGTPSSQKLLLIRFKDREFERPAGDVEFDRTQIGDRVQFTPPIPDSDPCNQHLWVCMTLGITAGVLAVWGITTYFSGRIAFLLSLIASGWISIIAWARICSHERNKLLKELEEELRFFEGGTLTITAESDNHPDQF